MKELFLKHKNLIYYFCIGVSASMIDVLAYVVLYNFLHINPVLATVVSISLATVWAFTLNAVYNFKITDRILARLTSYSFVSIIGMVLSASIIYVFAEQNGFNANIVKILTLPLIFVVQYLLNRHLTFKMLSESPESAELTSVSLPLQPKRLAVIGGGFTGLVAAYDAAKEGHDVTIYEFQGHLGGLASSFDLGGYSIERAYHFLYQSDQDILMLAKELGIHDKFHFHPSTIRYFHEGVDYPFMTPIDLIRFKPLSFIGRIRLGVMTLYLKKVKNWRPLSTVTAWDWLNTWMGKEVTREIWEPLLRGKFNHFYDKITMSWLWGRFNVRARSQNKDFSGEKLGYPEGGFTIIVDALVNELNKHNVVIKTNTGIHTIRQNLNSGVVLTTKAGENHEYDGVIATVPSPVFAGMIAGDSAISSEYIERLKSVDYLDAVVMVFRTTQTITDAFWYNIKDNRVPFLTLLSTSALVGTKQFGGSQVYFVGAYIPRDHAYMSDESDIEAEWKAGLSVMFPNFDPSQIQELKISKFKDAQHIVDIGYEENKLVPFATPITGLYLANFSQIYPDDRGTNFAVRDGRRVAALFNEYISK